MRLFYKMQARTLLIGFLWRITHNGLGNNVIVRLDDILVTFGRLKHPCKAMPHLQEPNEYQVINAHKGILA